MSVPILPHRLFCVGLLAALGAGVGAGQEEKEKAFDAQTVVAEFAKVREVFSSVDELADKTARWVKVQVGVGKAESWRQGWLVLENADAIELLEDGGLVAILSKKKLTAKVPAAEFGWSDLSAVADADFAAYCRAALAKKKEAKKDHDSFGAYRMSRDIHETQREIVLFARLTCWAHEAGEADLKTELATRSMRLHKELLKTYPSWGIQTEFHRFVAHHTYPRDKWDVTSVFKKLSGDERDERDAREQRVEQLAYLRRLVKIPYRPKHTDTVAAIGHYESLVSEDKAWKEPAKELFAKFNVQQKVDYWIYHLRDLDVHQSSQPGMCHVLSGGFGFGGQHLSAEKKLNAAVELKKLSYDAIPKIIAHLEDGRPTKCVGYWRNFAPESYHTLTYGDCCQQIFEAIALTSIYERSTTSGYPHRDGVAKQCKERAEAWWKDFQK